MTPSQALLGEIATIDRRGITSSEIRSGSRYVGLEHIESGGDSLSFSTVTNGELGSNKFSFGSHHILFGKLRPYLNKVVCPDFEGICSTDILPIAVGKRVNKRYLLHYLRLPQTVAWATSRATGVNLPRLSPTDLASLEIPLPSMDEQRRIAAILDKVYMLRLRRKHAIDLLESFTQSVFFYMFGDPQSNPRRLPKITLGDLIRVRSGNGLVAKDMHPNGAYPVYGGNGINGYHSEYMFDTPKVVIGRVGVYCGAVHLTQAKSWVTDNALYVAEVKQHCSSHYLAMALKQANLNQYAGRAAQPLVSGGRIYPIEILLPSFGAQTRFETIVAAASKSREVLCYSADASKHLLDSLQRNTFMGNPS